MKFKEIGAWGKFCFHIKFYIIYHRHMKIFWLILFFKININYICFCLKEILELKTFDNA